MTTLVTTTSDDLEQDRPRRPLVQPRDLLRWLPAVVAVLGTVGLLLWRDTAPGDILRYALYLAWGLMLPGTLVYRSLRGQPHSLIDDLAMGTAVGFVMEFGAWMAFSSVGQQGLLWIWPAAVVVLFLAVPWLRPYWRRPTGYRRPSVAWSWSIAGLVLVLMVYLTATFFNYRVRPDQPHHYYLDFSYLLSLTGEAKHHFPLHSPQVAAEPLHYHWFAFAHMASASLISHVSSPVVFFRLALPVICAVAIVLTAVVGWRVSGRPWVGVLAAALMYVISESADAWYPFFGLIGRWIIYSSPTASFAWLSTFPVILLVADRLSRDGPPDARFGRGAWPLLAAFAALASGSKSTVLPVVLGGIGLVALAELVTRRRIRGAVVASFAVVLSVQVLATGLVYGFESYGMKVSPFEIFDVYIPPLASRPLPKEAALLAVMGVAYGIYMLARMGGVPVLAWLGWRRKAVEKWSTTHWYLLGGLLSGLAGSLLLAGPAWAQTHILRTGWAFGSILSAMGFAALVRRHALPVRVVVGIVLGAVVLAFGVVKVIDVTVQPGVVGVRLFLPIFGTALATALVCGLIAVGWWVIRRRTGVPVTGIAAVSALALVLALGIPVTFNEIRYSLTVRQPEGDFYTERLTPDHIAVADWLRAHTTPDDVLATNEHCPADDHPQPGCLHLTFWLNAWAERRTLVSGWGYVPRSVGDAAKLRTFPGNVQFWDLDLLDLNDSAFYRPTAQILTQLRDRYGVHWLVADRGEGPESGQLQDLADLRFQRGQFLIYQLR